MTAAFVGLALAMAHIAAEEQDQRRAIEEARAAAIAAYAQEVAERQKRLAREKAERDAQRARLAHESQCQFKPVMTEDDIARCRAIYK
jgi:hypothetical protein